MNKPKRKGASARGASETHGRSPPRASEAFDDACEIERSAWLSRPRLHIASFVRELREQEIENYLLENDINVQDQELLERQKQKRKEEIEGDIKKLCWSTERLNLFMNYVAAYQADATIQNYLRVRQEFPEVEIQVGQFGGLEPLFALQKDFKRQGIDPHLIAAALDADEPGIDGLCLRLLELLVVREALPKSGAGHIEKRRNAISDATVNYLIAIMLEAYDWNDFIFRVPASLVVLIRHQICGLIPDLHHEARSREKHHNLALFVGRQLGPGEKLSINKLKDMARIPRTTAARLLADPDFRDWVRTGQKWEAEGVFKDGERAARDRLMS